MSAGTRGKSSESEVRKAMNKITRSNFAWFRPADPRGGFMQPALCDFIVMDRGICKLVEVKEVAHTCRLPVKNASPDQVARIASWRMAGAEAYYLINFTALEGKATWRVATVNTMIDRPTGSWLFTSEPVTLQQIMESIFG